MKLQLLSGAIVGFAATALGILPSSIGATAPVALNSNCTCDYDNGPGENIGTVPPICGGVNVTVIYTSIQDGMCAHSGCSGPAANCVATAAVYITSSGGCFLEFYRDTKLAAFAHDALGLRVEDNLACEDFVDWFIQVGGVPVVRITNICQDCPGA